MSAHRSPVWIYSRRSASSGARIPAHLLTLLVALHAASLFADDGERAAAGNPAVGADVGSEGIWFLTPGCWGTVHVAAFNSLSEPKDLLVTTSFEDDDNLQFGRRLWVPAHARVRTTHPVLAPLPASPDQQSLATRTRVFDESAAGGTLIPDRFGQRYQPGTFLLGHDEPVTAIVDAPYGTPDSEPNHVSVADFVQAARSERNLRHNVIFVGGLPPGETALDAVDQLVIADARAARDLLALEGIRRWLYGGGRLWIMLDRVGAGFLETLLGDGFACQIVDRISLTSVTIEAGPAHKMASEWSSEHEQPVELVRVVTSGMDVDYTVNGWPAAIWMDCGQGRLLVTTLGMAGWVGPRPPHQRPPDGEESHTNHLLPGLPLQQLAADFFVERTASPLSPDIADRHIRESVGYTIPSRSVVLGLMAAFVIVLAGLSRWLSRSGRLEWMGILGPVSALVIGGLLVAIGQSQRRAVPATVSALQFVQPISGTDDVRVTTTAGVYSPDSGDAGFAGTHGGWILPDATGMEDTTRRLVWTDLESWQWENLPTAPGLRSAVILESQRLHDPVRAEFRFDEQGVVGRLWLPDGLVPTDGVLATRRGCIGVEFEEGGTLRAPAAGVLTDKQFLSASVLTDEQVRRNRALQSMLDPARAQPYPPVPTLLFWTAPWDLELQFDERYRNSGTALVAIPVTFRRPAAGVSITIPAPLLPYREAIGVSGSVPAGLFDFRRLVWVHKSVPTSTWLQFQVPPALLPLEPQAARLVVRVDGPVGKLSIAGGDGDHVFPVVTWVDPVGTKRVNIDDPRVLSLTADGRLLLNLAGGDPDRPELTRSEGDGVERVSYWQIESLSLELTAVVASRSG